VVLYTGSLVPRETIATAKPDARVLDSSSMTLDEIVDEVVRARDAGMTLCECTRAILWCSGLSISWWLEHGPVDHVIAAELRAAGASVLEAPHVTL